MKHFPILAIAIFLVHAQTLTSQEADSLAPPKVRESGATLEMLNREVAVFRVSSDTFTPEQRVEAARSVILEIAESDQPTPGITVHSDGGDTRILADSRLVMTIKQGDVFSIRGDTMEATVERTAANIELILQELHELKSRGHLMRATFKAIVSTLLLILLIWLMVQNRSRIEPRLIRYSSRQANQIKSHTLRLVGLQNTASLLRGLMTTVFWTVVSIGTFLWLEFILLQFPHTRPFGEQLITGLAAEMIDLGSAFLHTLPDLGVVFLFWLIARFATSVNKRFFTTISRTGRSKVFDAATAQVTQRLLTIGIWVIAIILAFPYIPGSHSPAFRGISVLAGLMISLGSGNLISQMINGLMIIYSNIGRTGDHIKVESNEGILTSIGLTTSRIRSLMGEEIHLPNAYLTSKAMVNYSQTPASQAMTHPVKVSIGYNTPWRKVHSMLQEAARSTEGLRKDVEPVVYQLELSDFYVVYQLNVVLDSSMGRLATISSLHANIQDIFNANGVQIMSPHYREDPPNPVIVPREKWGDPA